MTTHKDILPPGAKKYGLTALEQKLLEALELVEEDGEFGFVDPWNMEKIKAVIKKARGKA